MESLSQDTVRFLLSLIIFLFSSFDSLLILPLTLYRSDRNHFRSPDCHSRAHPQPLCETKEARTRTRSERDDRITSYGDRSCRTRGQADQSGDFTARGGTTEWGRLDREEWRWVVIIECCIASMS